MRTVLFMLYPGSIPLGGGTWNVWWTDVPEANKQHWLLIMCIVQALEVLPRSSGADVAIQPRILVITGNGLDFQAWPQGRRGRQIPPVPQNG